MNLSNFIFNQEETLRTNEAVPVTNIREFKDKNSSETGSIISIVIPERNFAPLNVKVLNCKAYKQFNMNMKVSAVFKGLVMKPYVINSNGNVTSGFTATAQSVELTERVD